MVAMADRHREASTRNQASFSLLAKKVSWNDQRALLNAAMRIDCSENIPLL